MLRRQGLLSTYLSAREIQQSVLDTPLRCRPASRLTQDGPDVLRVAHVECACAGVDFVCELAICANGPSSGRAACSSHALVSGEFLRSCSQLVHAEGDGERVLDFGQVRAVPGVRFCKHEQ